MLPLLEDTANAAYTSSRELQDLVKNYAAAVEYPNTDIGNSLKLMAQVLTADVGLQVGYVAKGGFDTHAQQNAGQNSQPALLKAVADAIGAFLADIEAHGLADKVVVLAWSEFGRRVEENGSEGTDHGSAQPIFIAGSPVKGGLYGAAPSLTKLDTGGNLSFNVDFRSVYQEILEGHLEVDAKEVFSQSFDKLAILRA